MAIQDFVASTVSNQPVRGIERQQGTRTLGAILLGALLTALPAAAQITIYNFKGDPDGAAPVTPLIRDSAGNLYGTTYTGGTNNGTVFEVNDAGHETILHTFTGNPDGTAPWGGLIRDAAGDLYGTTAYGGAFDFGTVFKITAAGEESVVYSFAGPPNDGSTPYAGLILDSEGNLYGTTLFGGSGDCTAAAGQKGCGTVFKVSASGAERVLHNFEGGGDGVYPGSPLVRDSSGNLYGTTEQGGEANCSNFAANGCGTVFLLRSDGVEKVLHAFAGSPTDGEYPEGVILVGGNLYGTTEMGGAYGSGTVFEVTGSGSENLLYNFGGVPNDGLDPAAGLLWDGADRFFGTTTNGGGSGCFSGCGIVFAITKTGKEKTVFSFSNINVGCIPYAALIRDAAGYLYGTTSNCGTTGNGTVFAVKP
jgi:uncharacterized repeat protein (TIGR03803 family)